MGKGWSGEISGKEIEIVSKEPTDKNKMKCKCGKQMKIIFVKKFPEHKILTWFCDCGKAKSQNIE